MRVLHMQLTKNRGGIETLLLRVSEILLIEKKYIKFDFITEEKEKLPYEDILLNLGCTVYRVHSPKNIISYIKDINTILGKTNYDVVHLHKNSLINILPYFLAKFNNIKKIIIHAHNTSSTQGQKIRFLHYINRRIIQKSDVYRVACSNLAAKWIFGSNKGVRIIPNGIDIDKYKVNLNIRQRIREEYEVSEGEVLLISVGRLSKRKNHPFLVNIMKNLPDKYKLIIIGQGELKKELQKIIQINGLQNRVFLVGPRKDVENFLQAADIFLMPSIYEGLPISGIEAQATGMQLIVSSNITKELDVTGNVNFIDLNTKDWIEAIQKIKPNHTKNVKDELIEAGYDINETVNNILDLYI